MRLIGFMGRARHGKNTAADLLQSYLEIVWGERVQVSAFADGLKEEAARMLGHTVEYIEDNKEVFRPFLQWYGTEYIREFRDRPNHWIDQLGLKIDQAAKDGVDFFLVTDLRFLNEAKYIKSRGGILVSIFRPGMDNSSLHSSETDIPVNLSDYSIQNRTVSELALKMYSFCNSFLPT